LIGTAVFLLGKYHLVENNDFSMMNGLSSIDVLGSDVLIRKNVMHDSPPILEFNNSLNQEVNRTLESCQWDFRVNIINSWRMTEAYKVKNITIENNFFLKMNNQLSKFITYYPEDAGLIIRNNVYAHIAAQGSIGISDVFLEHNTFFNVSNEGGGTTFAFGPHNLVRFRIFQNINILHNDLLTLGGENPI